MSFILTVRNNIVTPQVWTFGDEKQAEDTAQKIARNGMWVRSIDGIKVLIPPAQIFRIELTENNED